MAGDDENNNGDGDVEMRDAVRAKITSNQIVTTPLKCNSLYCHPS